MEVVPFPVGHMRLIVDNLSRMRQSSQHSKRMLEEMAATIQSEINTCDDCIALVRNLVRENGLAL